MWGLKITGGEGRESEGNCYCYCCEEKCYSVHNSKGVYGASFNLSFYELSNHRLNIGESQ